MISGLSWADTLGPRSARTPQRQMRCEAGHQSGGRDQLRLHQKVLLLPGGRPCPASVSIENGRHLNRGKRTAGGHYGSSSNVSTTASSSSGHQGSTPRRDRQGEAVSVEANTHLPQELSPRGARGRGTHDDVRAHSSEQAGDWKHPVLVRRRVGGRRASGVGQPGWNCAHKGGPQAPWGGSKQMDPGRAHLEGVPQRPIRPKRLANQAWAGGQGQGPQVRAPDQDVRQC